jgi:hypothetical protein
MRKMGRVDHLWVQGDQCSLAMVGGASVIKSVIKDGPIKIAIKDVHQVVR